MFVWTVGDVFALAFWSIFLLGVVGVVALYGISLLIEKVRKVWNR